MSQPYAAPASEHADFLSLLPVVERRARIAFRKRKAADAEECLAEAVAAAFESHVALKARGQDPAEFPSQMAHYAVLHVKDDRHVGGCRNSRDVLSYKARLRRGFRVRSLTGADGTWLAQLRDDTKTPVPEQVCFRLDFSTFLETLSPRDRDMAQALAEGHAASEVADRFGLTPGRVTQLRQRWQREWLAFQGETQPATD